jgi:hypothetical protein
MAKLASPYEYAGPLHRARRLKMTRAAEAPQPSPAMRSYNGIESRSGKGWIFGDGQTGLGPLASVHDQAS